jgi:hypothetical protein
VADVHALLVPCARGSARGVLRAGARDEGVACLRTRGRRAAVQCAAGGRGPAAGRLACTGGGAARVPETEERWAVFATTHLRANIKNEM